MWRPGLGALAGIAVVLLAGGAMAQSVKALGTFNEWAAYSAASGNGQICFALSKPTDISPSPDGYTQAYLYLTDRPSEKISNELNLVAGFTFAADQPATLTVAGRSYDLFTKDDAAWLDDPGQNGNLAGVMRAGSTAVIDATTDKGIKVRETFSLSGATAASKAVASGC